MMKKDTGMYIFCTGDVSIAPSRILYISKVN